MAYAEICTDEKAVTAIGVLQRAVTWFAERGVAVERVLSDNGSAYRSFAWRDACTELCITPKRTRLYRPQTNGKIERFHRTLADGWAYARLYESTEQRDTALTGWLHLYNHRAPLRHRRPAAGHPTNQPLWTSQLESPKAVRVSSRLGLSMPANCTSTGKAMLSQLSQEELRRRFPTDELESLTRNSIHTRTELEIELDAVRRRGYATSNSESEESVYSVAVAFPAGESPVGLAMSVAVPEMRISRDDVRRFGELLRATVDDAAVLLH